MLGHSPVSSTPVSAIPATPSPVIVIEYDALEIGSRNLLLTITPRLPVWMVTDRNEPNHHTLDSRTSLHTVAPRSYELKV